MTKKKYINKTKILFMLLALLAMGQVLWWSHLLLSQQDTIALLDINQLEKALNFKRMVWFESSFFIIFWGISLFYTYKTFKEHEQLRKAHSLFLGGISHELKTPIANIMLSLETLERPNLDEKRKSQYIQKAQKSLTSLLEQVENILTLTSLESATHQKTKILVKPLVESILLPYFQNENIKKNEIEIIIDENFSVQESPLALTIMLKNLVDNALKYSQKNSQRKIHINCSYDGKKPLIEIFDNGIGMTSEELSRCSNAFWRSERVVEEAYAGTGMGLTLIHEIAQRSNIDFRLFSEGLNKGLKVRLAWR